MLRQTRQESKRDNWCNYSGGEWTSWPTRIPSTMKCQVNLETCWWCPFIL